MNNLKEFLERKGLQRYDINSVKTYTEINSNDLFVFLWERGGKLYVQLYDFKISFTNILKEAKSDDFDQKSPNIRFLVFEVRITKNAFLDS